MSNINRISNNPNADISKQAGGLCKITLRNTPHVSDKANRNCLIRYYRKSPSQSEHSRTENKLIGVLKNCKKDQKYMFSNDQNLYEIKKK